MSTQAGAFLPRLLEDTGLLETSDETAEGRKKSNKELMKLNVIINELKSLPEWIGPIQALTTPYVTANQLTSLPYNQLTSLSELIGQLHPPLRAPTQESRMTRGNGLMKQFATRPT